VECSVISAIGRTTMNQTEAVQTEERVGAGVLGAGVLGAEKRTLTPGAVVGLGLGQVLVVGAAAMLTTGDDAYQPMALAAFAVGAVALAVGQRALRPTR
jgi:hypothetical protein